MNNIPTTQTNEHKKVTTDEIIIEITRNNRYYVQQCSKGESKYVHEYRELITMEIGSNGGSAYAAPLDID